MKIRVFVSACTLLFFVKENHALTYCSLVGDYVFAQDGASGKLGTYLGLISTDTYASESIINQYGNYGSQYSTTSIFNQYGSFGGTYSLYSAYNPYTITPPIIWSYNATTKLYTSVAYLSKNAYLSGATADPDVLVTTLKSGACSSSPILISKDNGIVMMSIKQKFNILGRRIDNLDAKNIHEVLNFKWK